MNQLAEAMLAAHVQHTLERLQGESLQALIRERVGRIFVWLEEVKFDDLVTREQIMGVIDRYVIELRVSGGITELAGQMANVIFSSDTSAQTRLRDVLPPQSYEEFADKILGLRGLQEELIHGITHSAAFGSLASRTFTRLITDLLFQGSLETRLSGLVSSLTRRLLPGLEARIGAALSRTMQRKAESLARDSEKVLLEVLDQDTVREIADEIWDGVAQKTLASAVGYFGPQDLEDFVVLVYEFWLKFRKSDYFRAVTQEIVDQLFAKYGQDTVAQVIDDMGVTEAMVAAELNTFLGPILEHALRTGFLERELRTVLEPFYRSPALSALLPR